MKRLLLLLPLLLVPALLFCGCEELGLSKKRPVSYPGNSGVGGNDAGFGDDDGDGGGGGGTQRGPAPMFTAQPGDIQL